jgi:LacI family transcriptional regulator
MKKQNVNSRPPTAAKPERQTMPAKKYPALPDSISIKEIARRSGVSIGTVDRVVHNRGRVSKETDIKVRRIIEKTGYRPNIFASRLSRAKLFRFGVLMPHPDQDSGFWQLPLRGINRAANELRSHRIEISHYFFDKYAPTPKAINELRQRIMKEKPDGLLVAPVAPHWVNESLSQLPENCPYVFFDTNLPDSTPLSMIIQDSFQSGVVAARLAELLVGGSGEIVILQITPSDFHLLERARGFRSYFQKHKAITCLECEIDGAGIDDSLSCHCQKLLKSHPGLKGVFVTNAATFKAAEFLKRRNRTRTIRVIGYDLIPENIRYLKEGWIDFLINQRPVTQAYTGINTLYRRLVLDEEVETCVMMPIDIIAKENLSYYENRSKSDEKNR